MMARSMLAALVTFSALFLLLPAAASQSVVLTITGQHPSGHAAMLPGDTNETGAPNPDAGKGRFNYNITADYINFVCLDMAGCSITGEVRADLVTAPPVWAGHSVNPKDFTIPIAFGTPGNTNTSAQSETSVTLEVTWNVENRPATGATFTYTLLTTGVRAHGNIGPAIQDQHYTHRPYEAAFSMPDKTTVGPGTVDCVAEPDLPQCRETETADDSGGDSPGFDVAFLALAGLGVALAFRRRRA